MSQILMPMLLFTAIVLVASIFVLLARYWLLPGGLISVELNGRRNVQLQAGEKLLWALAEAGVYLPAACGGRGACGQCRVTVVEGATAPLPVEATHIPRRDLQQGVRLACMTTVRQGLRLVVAEDILEARQWRCRVVSNRNVSTFLRELVLTLPEGERMQFDAGDYVLLEAPPHDIRFSDFLIDPEYRAEWERYGLLNLRSVSSEPVVRAYSLANPPRDDTRLMLIVRIALPPADASWNVPPGRASSYIYGLQPGEAVTLSGPFGEFHVRDSDKEMILIAGGAGIAPMRSIIFDQLFHDSKRKMTFWYGARNTRELCYENDFNELADKQENFSWHIALSGPGVDEDWRGYRGFIHTVIYEHYLRDHPEPEEAEYYICGPPLMSAAVVHMLEDLGVESDSIFFDEFSI